MKRLVVSVIALLLGGCASHSRVASVDERYVLGEPAAKGYQKDEFREALTRGVKVAGLESGFELFLTPLTPAYLSALMLDEGTRLGWSAERIRKETTTRREKIGKAICVEIEAKATLPRSADLSQFGFRYVDAAGNETDMVVEVNPWIRYSPGSRYVGGSSSAHWHGATACVKKRTFDGKSFGVRAQPRFEPNMPSHLVEWRVNGVALPMKEN